MRDGGTPRRHVHSTTHDPQPTTHNPQPTVFSVERYSVSTSGTFVSLIFSTFLRPGFPYIHLPSELSSTDLPLYPSSTNIMDVTKVARQAIEYAKDLPDDNEVKTILVTLATQWTATHQRNPMTMNAMNDARILNVSRYSTSDMSSRLRAAGI